MSMWCGSDCSGSREWRAVPIQVKNGSPVLASSVSGYQGRHDSSHIPASRSPKKRLRPKTPSPPASPKVNITPVNVDWAKDSSIIRTGSLMDTNLNQQPLLHETKPADVMELPAWIRDLGPKQMLELQAENEGTLRMGKISNHALANWMSRYPELVESDDLHYEYNFLTQSFHIKCMALPTHDSLQIYFAREVVLSLAERFGRAQAGTMVVVASGTTFSGFTGDGFGTSRKLPDAYIQLPDGRFPTVVCEAGWAESHEDLMQDARLWLLHTNGETRIVIVISFTEKNPKTGAASVNPDCRPTVSTTDSEENEQSVLDSIDHKTDLNDLAQRLFELNQQGKLQHPLLGKINASLHIYKACGGGEDIVESFATTLLPPPPEESSAPNEFGITIKDLLGNHVPEGHNPADEIVFGLADLQQVMQSSIPRTTRLRATDRAIKLLKSTVGLDEEATFAQRKRIRYGE
ncbi:hypothetical protein L873DRAFT_1795520 [Choiromyces venosus 120613-1]|uniref:Uncharacterized protein n=1 Tax=Choiromyces venosus 120613-1 TaxID=1336337 RepID=A0A3N4IZD2_9PEZI|nr:hypothetical protein L873DRAFT_1795520 [Choiromyces venosus 120613-1]